MDDRERVLEWVIQGMRRYITLDGRQLTPPESVLRLQNEVVTEASSALRWLSETIADEHLLIDFNQPEEYNLPVKDAYQRYQQWAVSCGEKHPLPMRFFQQDIENRYSGTVRSGGMVRFKGVCMTPEFRRIHNAGGIGAINGGF
jgi:phage/plasmid-associated DNA primase